MVEKGIDPAKQKQEQKSERKARASVRQGQGTVKIFSAVWISERLADRSAGQRSQIHSRLERFVWPETGSKLLQEVRSADVLRIIEVRRATPNAAQAVRIIIQQVYDYAIQKLLVETNPAFPLRGVIKVPTVEHHRYLNERKLGRFWVALGCQWNRYKSIGYVFNC